MRWSVRPSEVPGGEHVRHDGPGDQEVAEHVGGEQVAEAVRADLPEADWFGHEVRVDGAHADADVVDQYVEAAEGCERAIDPDPDGGVLDALLGPAGEGNAGPGLGQGLAHGEAQAAGTSGDERADSLEIRVRRLIHAADLTVTRR